MDKKTDLNERCFFLETGGRSLYCSEYIPTPTNRRKQGVILCKPIWGERVRTVRIFVNLGRILRDHGYHVISCDYYGDGNSGGDTADLTFQGMKEDTKLMHGYLSQHADLDRYALIGLRVGANCAMGVADEIGHVDDMILIEPIPDFIEILKTGLRANLTSQMTRYKKILKNRDVLIQEIREGIPVNMDGFLITRKLWESFENQGLENLQTHYNGRALILALDETGRSNPQIEKISSKYPNGDLKFIRKEITWTEWKYYQPKPIETFRIILSHLSDEKETH